MSNGFPRELWGRCKDYPIDSLMDLAGLKEQDLERLCEGLDGMDVDLLKRLLQRARDSGFSVTGKVAEIETELKEMRERVKGMITQEEREWTQNTINEQLAKIRSLETDLHKSREEASSLHHRVHTLETAAGVPRTTAPSTPRSSKVKHARTAEAQFTPPSRRPEKARTASSDASFPSVTSEGTEEGDEENLMDVPSFDLLERQISIAVHDEAKIDTKVLRMDRKTTLAPAIPGSAQRPQKPPDSRAAVPGPSHGASSGATLGKRPWQSMYEQGGGSSSPPPVKFVPGKQASVPAASSELEEKRKSKNWTPGDLCRVVSNRNFKNFKDGETGEVVEAGETFCRVKIDGRGDIVRIGKIYLIHINARGDTISDWSERAVGANLKSKLSYAVTTSPGRSPAGTPPASSPRSPLGKDDLGAASRSFTS